MKRKLWLFLLLLTGLYLFAACACPGPEPQPDPVPPPEETVEPRLAYTFPPDEAQLKQVLDDLELDWPILERPKSMPEPSSTGPFMFYFLGNESSSTKILLQMWKGYHGLGGGEFSGKRVDMSFAFKDLAIEHICDDFREEDLPSVWTLAGELLGDRVAAAVFAQDSGEYFSKFDVNRKQRPDWPWYASLGAAFCRVTYRWYDHLQKYDLYQVTLWQDLELPRHFVTDFSEDSLNALTADQLTPVTELGLSLPPEREMAAYHVLGHLEQLQPVEDESGGLPQQGVLVDESGSVPVYLTTTWLNEYDLVDERVLTVYYINADQPYCIVDPNQSTAEVSRFKNK